jgi:hypothetical protein
MGVRIDQPGDQRQPLQVVRRRAGCRAHASDLVAGDDHSATLHDVAASIDDAIGANDDRTGRVSGLLGSGHGTGLREGWRRDEAE